MKQKILVTGGTGYIGSHTVVELQLSGYDVIIIDNLSNSKAFILDQITTITGIRPEFHYLDLNDGVGLRNFVASHSDITGIIHFAAYKSVNESALDPLSYYYNNITSLTGLLTNYAKNKINLVFSSSCTVYGEPDTLPVYETSAVKDAASPYGSTKQMGEKIISDTAMASENLHAILLRYFNPAGAHPSALIGELPLGIPQNLVPFITQTAMGKRDSLTIFGADYDTPDGSCIRDFIHVVDLAKAHVAALKLLEKGHCKKLDIFNIGTGKGTSVLQLINTFIEITGVNLNYTIGERRQGDIIKIWADVSKATEVLGWSSISTVHEMLATAWEWEKYLHGHPSF